MIFFCELKCCREVGGVAYRYIIRLVDASTSNNAFSSLRLEHKVFFCYYTNRSEGGSTNILNA